MTKDEITKRANKDLQAAKARGEKPGKIQDRDPYPTMPPRKRGKVSKKG